MTGIEGDRRCPRMSFSEVGPRIGYGPSIDAVTDDLPRLRRALDAHHGHGLAIEVGSLYHYVPTLDVAPRWAALRELIESNPGHGMFRDPALLDPLEVAALVPAPVVGEPTRDRL